MMWGYIQLADETQFAYSDLREDGTVLILIERPRDWGFDSARCILPSYHWSEIDGFSQEEIADFDSFLHDNAPFIFELAERSHEDRMIA